MKRLSKLAGRFPILPTTTLLAALLTGCETTGMSTRESGRATYSHFVYQAARNQPATAPKWSLHRPMRLAVAQMGEVAPPTNMLAQLQAYPDLIATVSALPFPGEARNHYDRWPAQKAPEPDAAAHRLTEIRSLARSLGADEVFVFGGTIDTYTSRNPLAVLDLTLVGMAIFPSAEVHAEGKAAGVLINVESGAIRFQVETEQMKGGLTPSAFASEKTDSIRVKARDALASSLTVEFIRKLRER